MTDNLERLKVMRQRQAATLAFCDLMIAKEELRILTANEGVHENHIHDKTLEVKAKLNNYRNLCVEAGIEAQA